jgi:hypothetical protein
MWKEMGMDQSGVLTQNLPGETEENHEILQSGYLVSRLGF